ncbi:MAG: hypothetical protein R3B09_26350 [Nannocystaceae bacterium]
MLDFAIGSLLVIRPRLLHAALVLALLCPGPALAAPPSVDLDELRERAEAHDAAGRYGDAAAAWEAVAAAAPDLDPRMVATMHAFHGWMLAFEASGEAACRASARAILRRGLDDPQIDAGWREELQAALDKLDADASPRVPLLDPAGEPRVDRRPASKPAPIRDATSRLEVDAPRRSPHRIAGAVSLSLAAPAVGGLVYALVRDAQITRQLELYGARDASSLSDDEKADFNRLGAEAFFVRDLAIGLGITSGALIATSVGLLVHARRRAPARPLALLPGARPGFVGVALRGRF